MDIILVSARLPKARTITIGPAQLALLALAAAGTLIALTTALNYTLLRHAVDLRGAYVHEVPAPARAEEAARTDTYLRDNLNAMAVRLGQMQAQLLRLDTLGERLARLAGFRPQELMFGQTPGQDGAASSIPGTPIHAAAGGVVVYADAHSHYGNMVEIDHGNDLVSRYAHASKLLVKVGDVVLSGARIAQVGRTGRATGTHLHFEVRHRGVPQNPTQFLRLPG